MLLATRDSPGTSEGEVLVGLGSRGPTKGAPQRGGAGVRVHAPPAVARSPPGPPRALRPRELQPKSW